MYRLISAERLFDGDKKVIAEGGVLLEGSRILDVGDRRQLGQTYQSAALEEEHFPGCTLLPGLIDAHVHLMMPGGGMQIVEWSQQPDAVLLATAARNAWLALRSGVTTVADFGAKNAVTFDLRCVHSQGILRGARLVLGGRALTITGGHAWPFGGEADGVDGVRMAVRQLCKEGADFIKVMVTGGGTPGTDGRRPAYSPAELQALSGEAHARNRRVYGHCTATEGIRRAVDAELDLIAHCQFFQPDGTFRFDRDLALRVRDAGIYINPTLQINRILASDRVDWSVFTPDRAESLRAWINRYPEFTESFRVMADMGIAMVCGSDCGWGYSPFGETHLELDAMVEAGLSPLDALKTATGVAADALGWGDRIGRLCAGLTADLLVVEGDPTIDVLDLTAVRQVWLEGTPVLGIDPFQTASPA